MFSGYTEHYITPYHESTIAIVFHKAYYFKKNWVSILHEHPIDSEITCINVDFEQFCEIKKFQHMGGRKLFFQVLKCLLLFYLTIKGQFLFNGIRKAALPNAKSP